MSDRRWAAPPAGGADKQVQVVNTGPNRANPPSRMVVQLVYRRGIESFAITTRLRHVPGSLDMWFDPLVASISGPREHLTIPAGALAGAAAELVVYSGQLGAGAPHLWALGSRLVVTLSGDLTRSELLRVASSLRGR